MWLIVEINWSDSQTQFIRTANIPLFLLYHDISRPLVPCDLCTHPSCPYDHSATYAPTARIPHPHPYKLRASPRLVDPGRKSAIVSRRPAGGLKRRVSWQSTYRPDSGCLFAAWGTSKDQAPEIRNHHGWLRCWIDLKLDRAKGCTGVGCRH